MRRILIGTVLLISTMAAKAIPIDQYADTVIGYSSQWSNSRWSASQVLDVPNTFSYGDIPTAWAPAPGRKNGTLEYVSVGFATPVYADGAVIRETYGNGFVYQIDVLDTSSVLHTVWSGTDTSAPGAPVDFQVNWSPTSFLVGGLKVYTDTDHDPNAWEEIDSIQLQGDSVPPFSVPEPFTLGLLGAGMLGAGLARRKRAV